jgi:hypothetical protein
MAWNISLLHPRKTAMPLVGAFRMLSMSRLIVLIILSTQVEYTPQAYVPSDLDIFAKTYAPDILGKRPKLVSIDGGQFIFGAVSSIVDA